MRRRAKRDPVVVRRPPKGNALAVSAHEVARIAMIDGICLVCGGAGWVGDHEVGCPIPEIQKEVGMVNSTYTCKICGRPVEEFVATKLLNPKECSDCYRYRTGLGKSIPERIKDAIAGAKKARAEGDARTAKTLAKRAKAMMAKLKRAKR